MGRTPDQNKPVTQADLQNLRRALRALAEADTSGRRKLREFLNRKFDEVDQRLNGITSMLVTLTNDVAGVTANQATMMVDITSTLENTQTLLNRVKKLSDGLADHDESLTAHRNEVESP